MVLLARGDTPESSVALSELCEAYWTPVYRFLRREGCSGHSSTSSPSAVAANTARSVAVVSPEQESGAQSRSESVGTEGLKLHSGKSAILGNCGMAKE